MRKPVYALSKQPNSISACVDSDFVVCCLDTIKSVVAISKNPRLLLASEAEQTSLNLIWSHFSMDWCSHDVIGIVVSEELEVNRIGKYNSNCVNHLFM